jgi:hypothetical protein
MVICLQCLRAIQAKAGVVMNTKQSGFYQRVDKKYYKVWHFGNTKR